MRHTIILNKYFSSVMTVFLLVYFLRLDMVAQALPVNQPPVFEQLLPRLFEEGAIIDITPKVTDFEGDRITFTGTVNGLSTLPAGASFDSASGRFIYYTRLGSCGKYRIEFIANDGTNQVIMIVPIEVIPNVASINNPVLYQDNFDDKNYALADASLPGCLSWNVVKGTVENLSQSILDGALNLLAANTIVTSNQVLSALDGFTLTFDIDTTWTASRGAILLFVDENNYYQMDVGSSATITRIMNGKPVIIASHVNSELRLPHARSIWGNFRISVSKNENGIVFKVGRLGNGTVYDLVAIDTDAKAINLFTQGKIGFFDVSSGTCAIDEVIVYKGELTQRRPLVTYFVDQAKGDDFAHNGMEQFPFRTIARATLSAMAGDTIAVNPGIYRESVSFTYNGSLDLPIILKAADSANKPIIDGTVIIVNGWQGPDAQGIYAAVLPTSSPTMYQDGVKLAVAMQPDVAHVDDVYANEAWYSIEQGDVLYAQDQNNRTQEENDMIAQGVEYLYLHDDFFRSVNGVLVPDDYWVGATLYHYNHYQNRTVLHSVVGYNAQLNRLAIKVSSDVQWLRLLPPEGTRKDRYALANHIGVLDKEGECVIKNSQVFVKPRGGTLTLIEASAGETGISLKKRNLIVDGLEVKRFTGNGITGDSNSINLKIMNSYVHHNNGTGLAMGGVKNIRIDDSEFAFNNANGLSFGSGSKGISLYRVHVHENNDNGIWFGSGGSSLFYAEDILIKDSKIVFQGSAQSHPDNVQWQQINNLIMDGNYLEQAGHQNMWCQYNGKVTFKNNIFVNGTLGLNSTRDLKLYNNIFDHSSLRFDAWQGNVNDWQVSIAEIDSTWGGWSNIQNQIRGVISTFPYNLLWDESLDFVQEIRSWVPDQNARLPQITDDGTTYPDKRYLKQKIIDRINTVLNNIALYRNNLMFYDLLNSNKGAKNIIDAVVKRGLLDTTGVPRLDPVLTSGETNEILGMNRAMIDELILDGIAAKSYANFRPRNVEMFNNVFLESSISVPPASFELKPYFYIDYNYFNILSDWLLSSWSNFIGFGQHSLMSRFSQTINEEFVDVKNRDYHLLGSSQLIDAGKDLGGVYYSAAPDIGVFEYEGVAAPKLKEVQGLSEETVLTWTHIVPTVIDSYTVYRSEQATGPFVALASGITDLQYHDKGLTRNIPYYYRVSAFIDGQESEPSNIMSGMATNLWGQDNFEDYRAWGDNAIYYQDTSLLNCLIWEKNSGGRVSHPQDIDPVDLVTSYWLKPGINQAMDVTYVYSKNQFTPDFVFDFDVAQKYVSADQGAVVLYIDQNNHYRINIWRYGVDVVRVLNGQTTVLSSVGDKLGMQHAYSKARFSIEVRKLSDSLQIKIIQQGWTKSADGVLASADRQAVVNDTDEAALNKFTSGSIGFHQLQLNTYNVAWYDDVKISALKSRADQSSNHAPVANNLTVQTSINSPVSFHLNAYDDDADSLRYLVTSLPAHGTLIANSNDIKYIPNIDYIGADSFTFKTNDGYLDSNNASASVLVSQAPLLYGDINADGYLNFNDVQLIGLGSIGLLALSDSRIRIGNVSGDNQISAYDAALVSQRALGLIDKFPIEG